MLAEPLLVVARVARVLDELGVPYLIGGSLASSTFGVPRATQDVDVVADLRQKHVEALVAELRPEFYIDAGMVRDAIRRRSSFNVIHLATAYKVDVFLVQSSPWARHELGRRRREQIGDGEDAVALEFSSPEDIILHKLDWYRQGGGVSDRQWGDVLGVLKVQGQALDFAYLREWAAELGLTDLLEQALCDAGPAS
jgi:hypothetical protein